MASNAGLSLPGVQGSHIWLTGTGGEGELVYVVARTLRHGTPLALADRSAMAGSHGGKARWLARSALSDPETSFLFLWPFLLVMRSLDKCDGIKKLPSLEGSIKKCKSVRPEG